MTDVLAKQLDRHPATDVYVFEISGVLARELQFWSVPVRVKFETAPDGRMWLLYRSLESEIAGD